MPRVIGLPQLLVPALSPAATEYGVCLNEHCADACLANRAGIDYAIISESPTFVRRRWGTFFSLMPTPKPMQ